MQQLLTETEVAINSVSEYIEEYESTRSWVADVESDFDDFDDREQAAFAEAFTQFSEYTQEPIPPGEIESVRGEMRKVVLEPLVRAILESIYDIEDKLELSLEESVHESFKNEVESWSREDLIDYLDVYDDINDELADRSTPESNYLRDEIEKQPHQLLHPASGLSGLIETTKVRHSRLVELETLFSELEWLELPNMEIGPFKREWLGGSVTSASTVEDLLTEIDPHVRALNACDLPAGREVSSRIEELVSNPRTALEEAFEDLLEALEKHTEAAAPLQHVPELLSALEEIELEGLPSEPIADIVSQIEESDSSSLNELFELIRGLREGYDTWTKNVIARWGIYQTAVDVLSDISSVDDHVGELDEGSFEEELIENPVNAVREFEELNETLERKRQDVDVEDGLSENSIQLLFDLIEERSVAYGSYDADTVAELNTVIDLQIVIDEST